VASELGVLDVLKSLFGTLQIPRSAIDEYLIVEEEAQNQGKESMSVGWHNNQFVREVHSVEENAARASRIRKRRLDIEGHCSVQPVTIPDSKTQLAAVATDNFGAQSLDAAYLAADRVLISDDVYYRHVALEACDASGVWLQAALIFARDNGLIDQPRYADAVAGLAVRRHEYLTLNVPTLLDVLRSDDTDGLRKFDAVSNSIGTRNADIASHILIVEHVLRQLWTLSDFPYLKQAKATSVLLEKLIRFQSDNWAIVLARIFASSSQALRRYLRQWIRGHFLPVEEVFEALRAIGSQQ
jgi:cellulose synthase operon protein C